MIRSFSCSPRWIGRRARSLAGRCALAGLIVLLVGATLHVGAETLVLSNGVVVEKVTVIDRGFDGTVTVIYNSNKVTFERSRYLLLTDKDVVLTTDGRLLEGTVQSQGEFATTIQTGAGVVEVPNAQIKKVARIGGGPDLAATAAPVAARGQGMLQSARDALAAADPVQALTFVRDAAAAGLPPGSEAASIVGDTLRVMSTSARDLVANKRYSEAREMFERSRAALADAVLTPALGGASVQAGLLRELDLHHARIYVEYANTVLERELRSEYPAALDALQRSRQISPSFEAALNSAELLVRLERVGGDAHQEEFLREADAIISDLERRGEQFPATWRTELFRTQHKLVLKQREHHLPETNVLAALFTPTPVPTPDFGMARPELQPQPVNPAATPTPAPTPAPTALQAAVDTWLMTPYIAANAWCYRVLGMGVVFVLIVAAVAVAFNWGFSIWYVNNRVMQGDLLAQRMQTLIMIVGLPALVVYFVRGKMTGASIPAGARCPQCAKSIENIEHYADLDFAKCPHCSAAIDPLFTLEDYIQHLISVLEQTAVTKTSGGIGPSTGNLSMGIVEKDAMQKLVRSMVTLGIRRRASDVHIEPDVEGAKIRMRIDGVLYDMITVPRTITNAFVSSIKVMANLDISERRIPQDGKISMWIDNADVDIRINTAPHQVAERVTMRLLDSRSIAVDSTKLGLEGRNLELFEQLIRRPSGVIYLTGPTGSGKTTTLYVALNTVNDGRKNLVTIEDPIEYQLKGVNQMQVNPASGFTFATGLRSILRSDPDVIMIGEVRDKETADIAVDAASTGHLVFTTLHTIDSSTVITRLIDLGVEPRRVSSSLLAAIAQRLVRVNCPECKVPYQPPPAELKQVGMSEEDAAKTKFYRGVGCDKCGGTGFQGRIGLYELMTPDTAIKEMIESGGSASVLREMARRRGMTTIREEGILRIMQGTTSVEEVIRGT